MRASMVADEHAEGSAVKRRAVRTKRAAADGAGVLMAERGGGPLLQGDRGLKRTLPLLRFADDEEYSYGATTFSPFFLLGS